MTPDKDGRFCGSCEKTVVDFTKKTNEEIAAYFLAHGNVCGKYRADQVSAPARKPRVKWLAAVLLFIFGAAFITSCRRHVHGVRAKWSVQPQVQDAGTVAATGKKAGLYALLAAILFSSGCIMGKRYDGRAAENWAGEAATPPAADSIVLPEGKQPE
jgi:hypothetical protein